MENPWSEVRTAMAKARSLSNAVDESAADMGELLVGRLYCVDGATLVKLKKELEGFNMQTWKWKP